MEAEMTINRNTQDLRIAGIDSLKTPSELQALCPASPEDEARIASFRHSVSDIIKGKDNRLLGIIGPCSIHDPEAAIDYASRLKKLSDSVSDVFLIVMRTYFEKPRTALGWKGLITDPDMDESCNIEKGLIIARKLLLQITGIGLPVGCEVLDPIVPQYTDELMSWSSIGARTTESQTHRSLASGLSVSVGFKNSTSGDLTAAVNAVKSASRPASFIGVERDGRLAVFRSKGNDCCHLILRGGDNGPNDYEDDVEELRRRGESLGFVQASLRGKEACEACPYGFICRGGCRRNRQVEADGALGDNYFCSSYKRFFEAALPRMREIAAALRTSPAAPLPL